MTKPLGNSPESIQPRAPRFAMEIPLRYRPNGELVWHEGRTENISRSGLLFRAEEVMTVDTPLEITLQLPVEIGDDVGAQVLCQGKVVRTVLPPASDAPPILAARILNYRLVRGHEGHEA